MTNLASLTLKQQRQSKPLFRSLALSASADSHTLMSATSRAAFSGYTLPGNTVVTHISPPMPAKPLEEQLYDARAACKIKVNQLAMHFGVDWQQRFFAQLDAIMSVEDWDDRDLPVTQPSFTTLIRILLMLRGKRRPGLGVAANGNIVAAWTNGPNRLTLECRANDAVVWMVTQIVDDEPDTAAGNTTIAHLLDRLASYNPEQWFANERPKSTA